LSLMGHSRPAPPSYRPVHVRFAPKATQFHPGKEMT
jgi:hypothetical protein